MLVKDLIKDLPVTQYQPGGVNADLSEVTTDPALCKRGFLYVADESETVDSTRLGVRLDGRDFIDTAIANGASAILTTPDAVPGERKSDGPEWLSHQMPLQYLGTLASRLYAGASPRSVALVTGTNGKTSTVNFCRMLWSALGLPSCSVGNLGGVCTDGSVVWDRDPTLSVPETVFLHKMLRSLALKGVNYVAMEATSHALHDYRLHGVNAGIGAFTNLTRDHLDFHGDMEEYFRMKLRLFEEVLPVGSFAVVNGDADHATRVVNACKPRQHNVIIYGRNGRDVRLLNSERNARGQLLSLEIFGKKFSTQLNLFGEFQASNAMCALSIALASGCSADDVVNSVATLMPVEGRLEVVAATAHGGKVIVDYAHTPDGIQAALNACRSFTRGSVIIVFGANGDRDPGKREEMGAAAASLADKVIVTDGHPRSENAGAIRKAVMTGAPNAIEVADRAAAIKHAIEQMGAEDTVLIAGFGHEKYQVIENERVPFDEAALAQQFVKDLEETTVTR